MLGCLISGLRLYFEMCSEGGKFGVVVGGGCLVFLWWFGIVGVGFGLWMEVGNIVWIGECLVSVWKMDVWVVQCVWVWM